MRIPLFIIAIAGLIVAGYLSVVYITGGPIVCSTNHGCEIIRASQYAHILGIPTPLYGVLFYVLLAIGAVLWQPGLKVVEWGLYGLTGSGLIVSAILTYISDVIVQAWCYWCVASAILATAAFILVWLLNPIYARKQRN